jgi:hypothetical protein
MGCSYDTEHVCYPAARRDFDVLYLSAPGARRCVSGSDCSSNFPKESEQCLVTNSGWSTMATWPAPAGINDALMMEEASIVLVGGLTRNLTCRQA